MKKVIRNILVPINFSNSADKSVQLAVAMCKRHGAALHLLKVNSETEFPYPSGKKALLIGIRLESRVAEMKFMESTAKKLSALHGIRCYFHIEDGAFSMAVAEIARNFYCDLIVIEKRAGASRFSLSFDRDICSVIQAASCPVMTVPDSGVHDRFKSILFPVWAKRTGLKKLHVALPIIEKNSANVVLYGSVKSIDNNQELNIISRLMHSVKELISYSTQNIEHEVPQSPGSAKRILRRASERNSDLIVIPSSTNTGFRSLFTNSYTRFIINNSAVPVLSEK